MANYARVKLKGLAPYSQSKHHSIDKLNKELPKDYEERTWRNRQHWDEDELIVIPAMAFKNCISEAAKFLSLQIPGKGKSTYTKHFESGVLCVEDVPIYGANGKRIHKDDTIGAWIFTPSDGVRGSGKRVEKCYPIIPSGWTCEVGFFVLDDMITPDVFQKVMEQDGQLIGIGRFRVRNLGTYGRFEVTGFNWEKREE